MLALLGLAHGLSLTTRPGQAVARRAPLVTMGQRVLTDEYSFVEGKNVLVTGRLQARSINAAMNGMQVVAAAPLAPPGPPPLTAEEAVQQAEAEGLTLLPSESSKSGYKGVVFRGGKSKSPSYHAKVWHGGRDVHLGRFKTPEEAALCYARSPKVQAAAAAPPPLTAEEASKEALRQADKEGLTLLRSESSNAGYRCVSFNNSSMASPYQATVWRDGKRVYLGCFATVEQAALCYARTPEARAAAPRPPPRKRKVKSEEQPPDVPADVVVILEGRFVESTTFE